MPISHDDLNRITVLSFLHYVVCLFFFNFDTIRNRDILAIRKNPAGHDDVCLVILAFRRLRQKDCKFKVRLGYIVSSRPA
jgi:hypothetical protein